MAEIGRVLGAETPVIDALIRLASVISRTDYRTDGLTLDKMGLASVAAEHLPMVLHNGFSDP
jgi:opine dehydrogenase